MILRDYQDLSITQLRNEFSKGNKKVLVFLATGAGKGLIMSQIAHNSLSNGRKVLTVMKRREIVFQTIKNYKKYHNIDASPVMAGTSGFCNKNRCQVCSIDTINSWIKKGSVDFLKDFDLVIIDECHDTNAPIYQTFFEFMGDKFYAGFSATPFHIGKKPLKFWKTVIKPIEPKELRDRGFLCETKTYAPSVINTKDIGVSNGEFKEAELLERATENSIVGDIVETYIKYGENKPAILFAINKKHSAIMCEAFNSKGIPAIHQDESHNSKEREMAISDLRSGKIKILCNINIFSTGVDIPEAVVGIMARPTMSEILWVQQLGRLLRPSPGKPYAIILDHAGNTHKHGGAWIYREAGIEGVVRKTSEEIKATTCPSCFAVLDGKPSKCSECEFVFKDREIKERKEIKTSSGELTEFNEDEHPIVTKHRLLKKQSASWKKSAIWFKLYSEFGTEIYKHLTVPLWMKTILSKKDQDNDREFASRIHVQLENLQIR